MAEAINLQEQAPVVNDPKIDELVALYIQCRDWVKAQKVAYEAKVAPKKQAMEKIEGHLQGLLDKTGQIRGACRTGSFYATTRYSATIADKDVFKRHVIGTEEWDLLDFKANVVAVRDFIKDHPGISAEVIGVKLNAISKIGVRRPGAGDDDE